MIGVKVPCPGPCNAAYRREKRRHNALVEAYNAAVEDWRRRLGDWQAAPHGARPVPPDPVEPMRIQPTMGDPTWCGRCRGIVRRALADLDDLAAALQASSDGHRAHPSTGAAAGTGGSRAPSPSPSPVTDLLDELYGRLVAFEDAHRRWRGYAARPARGQRNTGRTARARTLAVSWLLDQLDDILDGPAGEPFGRAALAWQRLLEHVSGIERPERVRTAPCPRCDMRALILEDDGRTRCRSCGRLMDEDEYNALADQWAATMSTTAEAS